MFTELKVPIIREKNFIVFNEHIIPKNKIEVIFKDKIDIKDATIFTIHLRYSGDFEGIESYEKEKERDERFESLADLLCDG